MLLSRRILISLLILLQLLFSCRNDHPKTSASRGVADSSKQVVNPVYKNVLQAFQVLRTDPLLNSASLGYLVMDVTGKSPVVVADYNSKSPMMPASTLKIFVTGAALEYFGEPIIPEVTITNQMSVNWRSSKLLRKIGGKVFHTATTQAGVKAILDFWAHKGVNTAGMNLYDGNGLSHSNAISPRQMVDALYAMRTSPYFKVFYESLPLAGVNGTLHKAMKGSAAEGRIHAKTGTIGKVRSFAGYVVTVNGRKLVFSLIVNNFDCRVKVMTHKMEEVMIKMAEI